MPKDKKKIFSMLGMARRAGKLAMGHDMAEKSIKTHKAKAVIFCSDVSERLINEFQKTIENAGADIPVLETDITMNEIHFSIGYKAGVMTLDDSNFAKRVIELLKEE
ncbi:MAG: ribosomal L7Ae/L30e/S12e/Gadd45 family protein [Clostridium sp.]|nr:ribosomal L7Ae/L30e/S12e/Gadd45 family protein [Clostridium sp.]